MVKRLGRKREYCTGRCRTAAARAARRTRDLEEKLAKIEGDMSKALSELRKVVGKHEKPPGLAGGVRERGYDEVVRDVEQMIRLARGMLHHVRVHEECSGKLHDPQG